MEYKLLVYNIASQSVYDYAPIVEKVTYTTNRKLSAGELNFTYSEGASEHDGRCQGTVLCKWKGIFEGYVFTIEQDRQGVVECNCL